MLKQGQGTVIDLTSLESDIHEEIEARLRSGPTIVQEFDNQYTLTGSIYVKESRKIDARLVTARGTTVLHLTNRDQLGDPESVLLPESTDSEGTPRRDSYLARCGIQLHRIHPSREFLLAITEVTQEQYESVMHYNPSSSNGAEGLPVEGLTFFDALEFCNQLSEQENLKPAYRLTDVVREQRAIISAQVVRTGEGGFRLPTIDELISVGGLPDVASEYAWLKSNSDARTHPVGRLKPIGGFFDLFGNVSEWCFPADENSEFRPYFGGNFKVTVDERIHKNERPPWAKSDYVGIRVGLEIRK